MNLDDLEDEYGQPLEPESSKTGPQDEHDWTVDRYQSTWECQGCGEAYRTGCDKKGYSDDPEGAEYLCRVCYYAQESDEDDYDDDPPEPDDPFDDHDAPPPDESYVGPPRDEFDELLADIVPRATDD